MSLRRSKDAASRFQVLLDIEPESENVEISEVVKD